MLSLGDALECISEYLTPREFLRLRITCKKICNKLQNYFYTHIPYYARSHADIESLPFRSIHCCTSLVYDKMIKLGMQDKIKGISTYMPYVNHIMARKLRLVVEASQCTLQFERVEELELNCLWSRHITFGDCPDLKIVKILHGSTQLRHLPDRLLKLDARDCDIVPSLPSELRTLYMQQVIPSQHLTGLKFLRDVQFVYAEDILDLRGSPNLYKLDVTMRRESVCDILVSPHLQYCTIEGTCRVEECNLPEGLKVLNFNMNGKLPKIPSTVYELSAPRVQRLMGVTLPPGLKKLTLGWGFRGALDMVPVSVTELIMHCVDRPIIERTIYNVTLRYKSKGKRQKVYKIPDTVILFNSTDYKRQKLVVKDGNPYLQFRKF